MPQGDTISEACKKVTGDRLTPWTGTDSLAGKAPSQSSCIMDLVNAVIDLIKNSDRAMSAEQYI